ncbi:RND family efflux transporter MFP subunit [Formosa agariphila KMM 3901]|uniref:RND family efflux transporter MFP subunit n=1 Tax=Formosa agariphila (strain DSM 15362 / KCTC 12365 / LMG 23005 / KMM 3901 / M-2Alg 35-1) TaxID=1347342 RepID=T2KJM0_FORAG|nr:efflux RND transporter periplasmic adaptor subunit [Formosa agariphila]CDF78621.1 RND family efflux transporter MFP subunit [Formosa agariphila KMM 3901]
MNKNIIYIGLALVVGLGLGFVFFGHTESQILTESHNHEIGESSEKWTCSMHPQIVRDEAGSCPICGMALIPIAIDSDGLTAQQFKLTKHAMALANIETTTIGEASSDDIQLQLSGTIQVNDDEIFIQPAHFNGRIEKLYVTSVGQKVNKGQLVAKIYSPALLSAQQELITAYKMKGSQPELYKAVRNKFKNWMIHDAQLNAIETSGTVINPFQIYSHVSGTVSEISAKEGDHVMDGKAIFKVANLNTVWAEFDAYENQISALQVGQTVAISAKAYPNRIITSKITFIDPILNASTRTVTVRAVLNNSDHLFKPGMFVEGAIIRMQTINTNKLTIPASAVMWTGKRSVVYLKANVDEPVFEMREIDLGTKQGDTYEVLDGVDVGDVIVTHGTFTVDAAAQLKGKASMMNTNETSKTTAAVIETKSMTSEKFKDVPEVFQKELESVLYLYLNLKDQLVDSDLKSAKLQADLLLARLNTITTESISNHPKMMKDWKTISEQMKTDLVTIQNEDNLKSFRSQFSTISLDLIQLIEKYGVPIQVYVQFCPMANTNKGGYWLSLSEEILNPYYGAAMLGCGENDKIL